MDADTARERLLSLRAQLEEDIAGIESAREGGVSADDGPEGGGDRGDAAAHEQIAEETAALVQAARRRMEDVDEALRRVEEGTYGISVVSGEPIPEERLEVRPDALYKADEEDAYLQGTRVGAGDVRGTD
ncbi:DnaK suppressor protein [Kineococcus xinjiangensis]|uniref:DnaK suppressor protein n=1 Tax=Kineococcus xinjiangensis TaxID=512762 RepID=A0A2S6IVR4_9ACTN|nr:hypothetical protein [Kineococcus xinjiangensis]PPK98438.1 DnaK suppressor protein [Kineococcus xinjiangensis]